MAVGSFKARYELNACDGAIRLVAITAMHIKLTELRMSFRTRSSLNAEIAEIRRIFVNCAYSAFLREPCVRDFRA